MKQLLVITIGLFLNVAFGQKDSVFHTTGKTPLSFPFEMKHYKLYLQFDSIENVSVIPYYARFTHYRYKDVYDTYLKTKMPDVDTIFIETSKQLDCLDEYASSHQLIYSDGFLDIPESYYEMEVHGKTLPQVTRLHCSKIINSKGQEVFIYIPTLDGPDSLERYNPFIAFEILNNRNPDYWNPREMVQHPVTSVFGYDLDKGTYFLNWQNENDSLHSKLKQLWTLVDKYEPLIDQFHKESDSLLHLFQTTMDKSFLRMVEAVPITSTYEDYDQQKNVLFTQLLSLGYGDTVTFNENKQFRFQLNNKTFLSHKISKKPISPEILNEHLNETKKKSKPNKAVKQLLETL